ncbi:uncharacterized protein LTR77_003589 [Saxophila tyrrhenica]|uniref:F-box domain-containing protein n=1 Tax=Saxophila tyrrhenica TaxID=1690608 RepID=A0AAV9PFE1_9PEZI|nr:hypothetical protein LTR77_003589 [Saxophila tyrrhenica]
MFLVDSAIFGTTNVRASHRLMLIRTYVARNAQHLHIRMSANMAAAKLFGTVELLEAILLEIPTRDIILAANTCLGWRAVVEGSKALREELISAPDLWVVHQSTQRDFDRTRPQEHPDYQEKAEQLMAPEILPTDFWCTNFLSTSSYDDLPWDRILVRRVCGEDYFTVLRENDRGHITIRFVNGQERAPTQHQPD